MTLAVSVTCVSRRPIVVTIIMTANNFSRTRRCAYNDTIRRSYAFGFSSGSRHSRSPTAQFGAVNVEFVCLRLRADSSNSFAPFGAHLVALRFVTLLVNFAAIVLLDVLGVAVGLSIEIPFVSLFLTDLDWYRFIFAYKLRVDNPHFAACISANRCALLEITIVVYRFHVSFFVTLLKSIATFG